MKIGVTGATGQLGRLIINGLKQKLSADQIVALARSPQKAADLGVEVRSFDYDKPSELQDSLKGIEKLMLISASEPGKRTKQHTNVIEAAKKAGVKYIVYTSLLRADTSTLVLAGEHMDTEKALKNSGIPFTILRNGWYTENYSGSFPQAISQGVLIGSSGDGKISSAARTDFADAAIAVLTSEGHEGKTYELAGDEAFTMSDLAAELAHQAGKNVVYKNLPVEEYADALVKSGMPEGYAQFFAGTHVATEKGDLFDDGHQLSKLTGKPTTPLADVVAGTLKAV